MKDTKRDILKEVCQDISNLYEMSLVEHSQHSQQQDAFKWYLRAAYEGNADAQY